MTAAAFFDLDRTLLPKASGTIFAKYLEEEGIGTGANIPGAGLVVALYDMFGETKLNMQLTAQFVKRAKGWPVDSVERAAKNAAPEIADAVLGYAKVVIEKHRRAGVKLVLATTTPTVLVSPLAEELGFDAVVATEWSHDGEVFDGTTVGPFVWGPAKRDAVQAWADENGVSMVKSFAYSDSYFDAPMLDAVGNAVAVNPDARLAGLAALQGWPIRNFDAPPGVLKVLGKELQSLLGPLNRPGLLPLAEYEISGLENIPEEGPAILVFNHRSYFDALAMQLLLAKTGRPCRFLAKKEMFDTPGVGPLVQLLGGIQVDRGTAKAADSLKAAVEVLTAGDLVGMAPQGTIPRCEAFFDPVLVGRPGAANLAKETRAPVIPVGIWGTEKVWPRNSKLPKMSLTNKPTVSMTVGEPVELKYRSANADTKRIMAAISAVLPPEANEKVTPTEAQLALTMPSSKS